MLYYAYFVLFSLWLTCFLHRHIFSIFCNFSQTFSTKFAIFQPLSCNVLAIVNQPIQVSTIGNFMHLSQHRILCLCKLKVIPCRISYMLIKGVLKLSANTFLGKYTYHFKILKAGLHHFLFTAIFHKLEYFSEMFSRRKHFRKTFLIFPALNIFV